MNVPLRKKVSKKQKLSKAKKISKRLTQKTKRSGVTQEQLEKDTLKAYGEIKPSYRSSRN